MIKLVATTFVFTFIFFLFLFLITNTFLTIRLRNKKIPLINEVSNKAPIKFRSRAKFMMESNLSWVSGFSSFNTWYLYFLLRYAWKVSNKEIRKWNKEIEFILGRDYKVYCLNSWFINILLPIFPISIIFAYLSMP